MMKAVVLERPGVLSIQDFPVPRPGEYQVLCELLYGATCSGTDLHLIDNTFPWPVQYPGILGHESIGAWLRSGPRCERTRSATWSLASARPRRPAARSASCGAGGPSTASRATTRR